MLVMLAYYFQMGKLVWPNMLLNIPALVAHQPFRQRAADDVPVSDVLGAVHRLRDQGPDLPVPHLAARRHVEAPTAISVILAGVLLKMGGYADPAQLAVVARGRRAVFGDVFPGVAGIVNIIYGAFCALGQTDFKRLVAYSSVSHMGYVLLGWRYSRRGRQWRDFPDVRHGISSR
jgi:hypothetical protein